MKPRRDLKHLQWIRTLPCVVCGSTRYVEAAHTGPHGLGQKSADSTAIPLCIRHHRTGNDSYHKLGPRQFAEAHQLEISEILNALNAKPNIRVVAGVFIGNLRDDYYQLGPTHAGLSQALSRMIVLRRIAVRQQFEDIFRLKVS
jgi:hypothetical protein